MPHVKQGLENRNHNIGFPPKSNRYPPKKKCKTATTVLSTLDANMAEIQPS